MKIIVVSDSHGDLNSLKKIMNKHRDADAVIHCGDSRSELDEIRRLYPDKEYHLVKGNCDLGSTLPEVDIFTLDGVKFFVTHGHLYTVKWTFINLKDAAKKEHADVAVFGHTHQATDEYDDGLRLLNPGSCGGYYGTYAIVETRNGQILTNIVRV